MQVLAGILCVPLKVHNQPSYDNSMGGKSSVNYGLLTIDEI